MARRIGPKKTRLGGTHPSPTTTPDGGAGQFTPDSGRQITRTPDGTPADAGKYNQEVTADRPTELPGYEAAVNSVWHAGYERNRARGDLLGVPLFYRGLTKEANPLLVMRAMLADSHYYISRKKLDNPYRELLRKNVAASLRATYGLVTLLSSSLRE